MTQNSDKDELLEEDDDICRTCKSFSRVKTSYNCKQSGWCMKRAKSVSANDTCGKHRRHTERKYAQEAFVCKWW